LNTRQELEKKLALNKDPVTKQQRLVA